MSERLLVARAAVVVALLVAVVAGIAALGLLAVLVVARDASTWDRATVRLIVFPFVLAFVYGIRVLPPALAARARSQGRVRDADAYERATKVVYAVGGVLLLALLVFVFLQMFPLREVLKILLLPPIVVGGIFVSWMYADMAGGTRGWTFAAVVLAGAAVLTWLILQL
jgi:hypothetical protein